MKILIVDDSSSIRSIVSMAVLDLGFEAEVAECGTTAMEKLERDPQEIVMVILDWNMPRMTGIEVLKSMKSDRRFRHIAVVMATTESEKEKVLEALRSGAKGYLIKPFTIDMLRNKIAEVLKFTH